ncbi:MAG TPA: YceI family protein [Acidobacteriaceae bacterium]|jgi:polyisoprenoid-binding protein YceI|nr:YceI family protein [Acidobacteriaceae bacterium]
MKLRLLRQTVIVCALLLGALPLLSAQSRPQQITLHFDPSHTHIHWTLDDVLHTVHGRFQLKGGLVTFNPATGGAEGELLVDLDTGNSGSAARDSRMKKDVLETQTYPEAIFHPEKVSGTLQPGSAQQVTVDGTFTIHGHDHPLRLVVSARMTGSTSVHLATHFVVPYVQWGMKDPSSFVLRVGKQVPVDVTADTTVEGLQQP